MGKKGMLRGVGKREKKVGKGVRMVEKEGWNGVGGRRLRKCGKSVEKKG